MNAIGRAVLAVGATAVLLGLLVGVPAVLWVVGGRLVRWPGGTVLDILTRPDDGTVLMAFLVAVGAGAWLMLALSIVGELVAVAARRPSARITLPGFRWSSSVAAALVAAVVGAGPAMATPALAAHVTLVEAARAEPMQDQAVADAGPVHVVQHRDTLWRIAETALGDPLRWREIYALNADRVQPDGGRLTEASILVVGWRLALPDDARPVVRVEPGDTLSELAAEHLGDPDLADRLFELNAAAPQPGGATLTDPDLIRPGWTLTMPDDRPPETGEPPADQEPAPATPDGPTATVEPEQNVQRDPETTPPLSPPAADNTADQPTDDGNPTWAVAAAGMSAVIAGGLLASLTVHRRRQLRHRPGRHRVAVPSDDDGRVEWSLQHPDAKAAITCSAAEHLDLALRCLTRPDATDEPLARINTVRLTDADALVSTVGAGTLPAPFGPTEEQAVWSLDGNQPLPIPADEARGCCAPFPTLVTIGSADTRTLIVDLEQRGVVRVGGEPGRGVALLRHIAAELATSPSAEDTEIIVVAMDEDLLALNPEQVVAMDLARAAAEVQHRAREARAALHRHELESVVDGRRRNIATDSWLPTVVLVGRALDDDERAVIDGLDVGGAAVAIVVLDDVASNLVVSPSGTLHIDGVDDGPWTAVQLTEQAGTHLAALLGTTGDAPEPVYPLDRPDPWAEGMDEDGGLTDTGGDPLADDESGDAVDGRVPEPRSPADDDSGPDDDPEALRKLAIVEYQDPHLDDDLAIWLSAVPPPVPLIAILGEPMVRAPGPFPKTRASWFAEVLVYLSLHPAGVTPEKAATDLWPDGHRIRPATVRHAFFGARRWAGRGLGGDPDVQFVSGMQHDSIYRLRGHLLDWDLFRRLRKRAQARREAGREGALADYEAALSLIRGPVLSPPRPGGYAWLNNHDQRHDLQIPGFLIDTAHELVDLALEAGDTVTARRTAERARLIDIDVVFDRPLTDLMRIAHAEDNRSELELYAAVLLDARGFDVPEELAPDSFAVLNDLLPHGPRRPG